MAAGTTPTLTARDSSQIFSVGKVQRSLLKHSSILNFGPIFSWMALKLHKDLFASWLMFIHIHHTHSTRRPLGEKWQRRQFTSYVLLVPVASWPDTAKACVPHPCCVVAVQRFIFSGGTTTCAPCSCTNPTSHPNAGDWSIKVTGMCWSDSSRSLRHHQGPGFSWAFFWQCDPLFLLPSYSLLWQRRWEFTHPWALCSQPGTNLMFRASSALALDWDTSGGSLSNSFLSHEGCGGQGIVPAGKDSRRRRYKARCASSLKMP